MSGHSAKLKSVLPGSNPAIIMDHLSHTFSDDSIGLDNINLSIASGEFVVLAGPNGSGKSTLLKHLNGILSPSKGNVYLNGQPVAEDLLKARRLVGMVFQDADSQIVGETVWEDIAFGPRNLSLPKSLLHEKVESSLEIVGLQHLAEKPPYLLSGGEKRRLAIAGVLAMDPEIIAFDEPFSNLDYPSTVQVRKQMQLLRDLGHTLIVATHELENVYDLASRLIIMRKGHIVRDGFPDHVLREAQGLGLKLPSMLSEAQGPSAWQT